MLRLIARFMKVHRALIGCLVSGLFACLALLCAIYPLLLVAIVFASFQALVSLGLGLIIHDEIGVNARSFTSGVFTLSVLGATITLIEASFPLGYLLLAINAWMAFWMLLAVPFVRKNEPEESTPKLHLIQNTAP